MTARAPNRLTWGVLLASLAIAGAKAAEMPLEIHGALSATAAYSDRYNYLGETKDRLDVFSNEVTLNGTHRFGNGIRFGAQIYAYKLDQYRDLTVDFASLDYALNERIGFRVGRSKQAVGLYGDTQDIDMIRPLALLPLDAYPKSERSYGASYDGAAMYGTLPLPGAAGSVDYHFYGGAIPRYRVNDPWLQVMNDESPLRVTEVNDAGRVIAGSVYWNTPVDGLKIGASASRTMSAELTGVVRSVAELQTAAGDIRVFPATLPPGLWDGVLAGRTGHTRMDRVTQLAYALEYTHGAWVFAAEYHPMTVNAASLMPVIGQQPYNLRRDDAYVMATWQAAAKWQFAAYYAESYGDISDRDGARFKATPAHRAWTKDKCVAASYSLARWWLLKAQVNFLDGTQILTGANNVSVAQWKPNWALFVVKSTISF